MAQLGDTFSKDASYKTIFKRRFDLKAILGTHEFAYRNWMLMERNKSGHLTNNNVTVPVKYCAGQKWHNPISYYIKPSNRDAVS